MTKKIVIDVDELVMIPRLSSAVSELREKSFSFESVECLTKGSQ